LPAISTLPNPFVSSLALHITHRLVRVWPASIALQVVPAGEGAELSKVRGATETSSATSRSGLWKKVSWEVRTRGIEAPDRNVAMFSHAVDGVAALLPTRCLDAVCVRV